MKSEVIRCRHLRGEHTCGNPIGVRDGNIITVRRHGREIKITLQPKQTVTIKCERCGKETKI